MWRKLAYLFFLSSIFWGQSCDAEKNIKEQVLVAEAGIAAALQQAIRPDGQGQKPVVSPDQSPLCDQNLINNGSDQAQVSASISAGQPGIQQMGVCSEKTVSRLTGVIRSLFGTVIAVGRFLHTVFGRRSL